MASPELHDSWRKTTELLRDARSHLSEVAEGICENEIAEFEDYLSHNELELALDALEAIAFKSPCKTLRVLELLISAAESMGLECHAARYRAEIERVNRGMKDKGKNRDARPICNVVAALLPLGFILVTVLFFAFAKYADAEGFASLGFALVFYVLFLVIVMPVSFILSIISLFRRERLLALTIIELVFDLILGIGCLLP